MHPWNLDATIGRRTVSSHLPRSTGALSATRSGLIPEPTPRPTVTSATATPAAAIDPVELNTRGYELFLAGKYARALPFLHRAVAGLNDPSNPVTYYANINLGQTLVKLGQCASAIPYLAKATQLEPRNRMARDALGYARACQG